MKDMGYLFSGATSFNGAIGGWDVSKVTTMMYMFHDADAFVEELCWDVSHVSFYSYMFESSVEAGDGAGPAAAVGALFDPGHLAGAVRGPAQGRRGVLA